jgi:predicted PurR-regulated permease PerM
MIVVASWPVLLRIQGWLWGRRWLAVVVMTVALLLVFVLPFSLAIGTIVANADVIAGWAGALDTLTLPQPPDWLQAIPFVGGRQSSGATWLRWDRRTLQRNSRHTQDNWYGGW